MALVTVAPDTVQLIAESTDDFRVENLSAKGIRVAYAAEAPAFSEDWGTLPSGSIEIRTVGGNLYGYSPVHGAKLSVFTTTAV